ncbi:MAG TPA: TetR/AcrR family transcriptional regulator [Alphaproteobacteria bacterium]|nr:TetR/AcrR family transcriptional regulator [Alphaproteobacteria bacterium]
MEAEHTERPERLDREAWVEAAFAQLGEAGVNAVRVEPLAKRLGVTKGSFYWHFRDRDALLVALLEAWKDRETDHYMAAVEAEGGQPGARLRRLFRMILADRAALAPELAIRDWARRDKRTAEAVLKIDTRRSAYLQERFVEAGQPQGEAQARAALLYGLLMGEVMIRRRETPDERTARIDRALVLLTGDR